MQTAAAYYNIKMYLAILVVPKQLFISYGSKTLEQSGFKIRVIAAGNNPIYSIKYAENTHPVIGFSKKI
jgi:arsenate reductase